MFFFFYVNDPVWLSAKVHAMRGPVNVEVTDGHRKTHINRTQPCVLPSLTTNTSNIAVEASWIPPHIEHFVDY